MAVDQKFTESIYGGAAYTLRELEVPVLGSTDTAFQARKVNWDEERVRAYLLWMPHGWMALRAQYEWEQLNRDGDFADGATEVETHRVPFGINFFHPAGLRVALQGTYIHQDGSFDRRRDLLNFASGRDDFWLFDATINYRLPKRYGFITVGATNLLDKDFEYFDTDRDNPRIQPDRSVFAKFTLALP